MVIAPSDYDLVDMNQVLAVTGYSIEELRRLEQNQQYGDFTDMLRNAGLIPEGKEGIDGVKMVEDRDFYIKYY